MVTVMNFSVFLISSQHLWKLMVEESDLLGQLKVITGALLNLKMILESILA